MPQISFKLVAILQVALTAIVCGVLLSVVKQAFTTNQGLYPTIQRAILKTVETNIAKELEPAAYIMNDIRLRDVQRVDIMTCDTNKRQSFLRTMHGLMNIADLHDLFVFVYIDVYDGLTMNWTECSSKTNEAEFFNGFNYSRYILNHSHKIDLSQAPTLTYQRKDLALEEYIQYVSEIKAGEMKWLEVDAFEEPVLGWMALTTLSYGLQFYPLRPNSTLSSFVVSIDIDIHFIGKLLNRLRSPEYNVNGVSSEERLAVYSTKTNTSSMTIVAATAPNTTYIWNFDGKSTPKFYSTESIPDSLLREAFQLSLVNGSAFYETDNTNYVVCMRFIDLSMGPPRQWAVIQVLSEDYLADDMILGQQRAWLIC
eukprot:PhF_6_TR27928/c0_g1_i6/m.41108